MRVLSLALAAAVLGGCANYATLQDPETIPKKELQLGFGVTFNAYPLELETTGTTTVNGTTTETTTVEDESFTVPALTFSARYGVSDRFEMHGIAWMPFGASIGGKYMLVGDRKEGGFAFSPGLDVSAPITVSIGDSSALLFDLYVPLHMGYRTSPDFELYWTPKYVLRAYGGRLGHAAGGTVGLAIGETTQFLIEGGALYDTLYEKPILNGALGIAFM